MPTVQMASGSSGIGGVIQALSGTYVPQADGTYLVNVADAPDLLKAGFTYMANRSENYTFPLNPLVATSGQIVASVALSNGTLAIANQPDVMRPVQVIAGAGTVALTGGNLAVSYTGNDGQATVDNVSFVMGANVIQTVYLSKGVVRIASAILTGVAGGASPFIHLDTTSALAVPIDPGAKDFALFQEICSGVITTASVLLATVLGGFTPTTAPNHTVTYSVAYNFVSPNV